MKDHFSRFAIRFVAALLLGLAGIALRSCCPCAVSELLAPRFAAPWELSKLGFWPVLCAVALTGRLSGGVKRTLRCALPCLTLTPAALFLVFWGMSLLEPAGGAYLLVWVAALAVSLALADQRQEPVKNAAVWLILTVSLGVLYGIFTFLPPAAGPFLDPRDVAAMAVIPY
jgi:hypothetical protein